MTTDDFATCCFCDTEEECAADKECKTKRTVMGHLKKDPGATDCSAPAIEEGNEITLDPPAPDAHVADRLKPQG